MVPGRKSGLPAHQFQRLIDLLRSHAASGEHRHHVSAGLLFRLTGGTEKPAVVFNPPRQMRVRITRAGSKAGQERPTRRIKASASAGRFVSWSKCARLFFPEIVKGGWARGQTQLGRPLFSWTFHEIICRE